MHNEVQRIGYTLFYQNNGQPEKQNWYAESIPQQFTENSPITCQILKYRNICIFLCFLEVLSGFLGLTLFFFRRNFLYLIVNMLVIISASIGLFASIRLTQWLLVPYIFFTIVFPGALLIYQLLMIFISNDVFMSKDHISEKMLIAVFSLPYFYDFICGIYAILLFSALNKHYEVREKDQVAILEDFEVPLFAREIGEEERIMKERLESTRRDLNCIICMTRKLEIALNPCFHFILCCECKDNLEKSSRRIHLCCPLCRKEIKSYERIYLP